MKTKILYLFSLIALLMGTSACEDQLNIEKKGNLGSEEDFYHTDAEGVKRYVTSGQINITRAEDADGNPLYSFSGSDLSTLTAQNVPGTGGSFNVTFASYIVADQTGTVLRDQTIHSDVLGRDMLYSVYLPASWSAEDARTYPRPLPVAWC